MFHLFNKVYLAFDTEISAYENRIVISEELGGESSAEGIQKPQLHWSNSIPELIDPESEFKTPLEFFEFCLNYDSRLVIYCDKRAFVSLFIMWHKLFLSDITERGLWRVFLFYLEKTSYYSAVTDNSNFVNYDTYSISNWNESDFNAQFKEIDVEFDQNFTNKTLDKLGIEYLFSSYFKAKTTKIKNALKKKLLLLSKRAVQGEIYEVKMHLMLNSQNKKLHEILDVDHIDSVDHLFSIEPLSIFNDPELWDKNDILMPSSTSSSLDMTKLNSTNIIPLISAFKLCRNQLQGIPENSLSVSKIEWLNWIIKNSITDAQLNTLINDPYYVAEEIGDPSDNKNINVLFVDWVLANKSHLPDDYSIIL